jgi:hypothetical protein
VIEHSFAAMQPFVAAAPFCGAKPARELHFDLQQYGEGIVPRSGGSKHPHCAQSHPQVGWIPPGALMNVLVQFVANP